MTSMTRQYSAAATHARNAVDKTADVWTEGARTVTGRLFGLPQVDLVPAVERYVDLPPFGAEPHLRLRLPFGLASYATTSIGIVVVKG